MCIRDSYCSGWFRHYSCIFKQIFYCGTYLINSYCYYPINAFFYNIKVVFTYLFYSNAISKDSYVLESYSLVCFESLIKTCRIINLDSIDFYFFVILGYPCRNSCQKTSSTNWNKYCI